MCWRYLNRIFNTFLFYLLSILQDRLNGSTIGRLLILKANMDKDFVYFVNLPMGKFCIHKKLCNETLFQAVDVIYK